MSQYPADDLDDPDFLCTANEEIAIDLGVLPASTANASTSVQGEDVVKNRHLAQPSLWAKGQTLKIAFQGGTDFQKREAMEHSREWCKWTDLKFEFVTSHPCDIYIGFKDGSSWSVLGTKSHNRSRASPPRPSMNLGWIHENKALTKRRRTILHEFGHALGLVHEHQNAQRTWDWDVQAIYDHYGKPPNNWPPAKVDRQIFEVYTGSLLRHNEIDVSSIMMYPSLERFIRPSSWGGSIKIPSHSELSNVDKAGMLEAYSHDSMGTEEREFAMVGAILGNSLNEDDQMRRLMEQGYKSSRSS